jgi:hypothetical protein
MIAEYALGNASPRQIFDTLDHPGAQERFSRAAFVRGLSSVEGRSGGTLTVAVDEQDGKVLAFGIGLDANREYRLCVRSAGGGTAIVGTFSARQSTWAAEFPVSDELVRDLRAGSVELLDADGAVVMRG